MSWYIDIINFGKMTFLTGQMIHDLKLRHLRICPDMTLYWPNKFRKYDIFERLDDSWTKVKTPKIIPLNKQIGLRINNYVTNFIYNNRKNSAMKEHSNNAFLILPW